MIPLCKKCSRPTKLLFISSVCDWCDGVTYDKCIYKGYVVWRPLRATRINYVFKTIEDATKWRLANQLVSFDIVEVSSENEFIWRETSGNLKGVNLADRQYEIFPDHNFHYSETAAWLS